MMTLDNESIVYTGPGTLAGRYLRMFWQPVYRAEDLAPGRAMPVRIMSEDFTLYRGEGGISHVVAFRCAHRGTQLSAGWVEEDSIRCFYHGWKYDGSGQCVEQPGEEESFKSKVKIRSYPTQEYLGLIFAYLGEGEPPPFRVFPDTEKPGVAEAYPPEYWPCNYFNRIDNACDAGHLTYAHRESRNAVNRPQRLPDIAAEETEYGVRTDIIRGGKLVSSLHFHMPNTNHFRSSLNLRDPKGGVEDVTMDRFLWRVPVDDKNCVSFPVDFAYLSGEAGEQYLERRRRAWRETKTHHTELGVAVLSGKLQVREVKEQPNLKNLTSLEDYVAQVGQGAIADRATEQLGRMDVGVILTRKIWLRELQALAENRALKRWADPAHLSEARVD